MKKEGEIKVKSLQKSMEILECFAEKQPLGVTEISEKLGLYKSNVHNILMTFTALGYLEHDKETGKYHLGASVMTLSRAFREGLDITKVAVPFMRQIANETKELVYLTIPREDEVIYLEVVSPENQKLVTTSVAGERCKMYCTGVGKAILASLPEEERSKYISGELEAYTENTIIDPKLLQEELALTKMRGYGIDDMELMYGIKCVGVALVGHDGRIEGGLSISAPSPRMDDEKVEFCANLLKRYAMRIREIL